MLSLKGKGKQVLSVINCFFIPIQDFGDYSDRYYSVQTTEGEQIAQLIAGYIDIILKKVRRIRYLQCRC